MADTLYHFINEDTAWLANGAIIPVSKAEEIIGRFIGMTAKDLIDTSISGGKQLFNYGITLGNDRRISGKVMSILPSAGLTEKGRNGGQIPSMAQVCISNSGNNQIYVISLIFA